MPIILGLLFGGRSGAHNVSVGAAQDIYKALQTSKYSKKYHVIPFYIQRDGRFAPKKIATSYLDNKNHGWSFDQSELPKESLVFTDELTTIDVCLSTILCGVGSGDGSIQGFIETLQIPLVGSSVLGASIGADKITMKRVFAQMNIPQVKYISIDKSKLFSSSKSLDNFCDEVEKSFRYPYFVKPSRLGSSLGISMANNRQELKDGFQLASSYDHRIIVEQGIKARELSCAVLGNIAPQISILAEKVYENSFNSYDTKYKANQGQFKLVQDLPDSITQDIKKLANLAFKAIACLDACRIDFFLLEDNQTVMINEVNTVFGFKESSMFSFLWKSVGIEFPDLIDKLITLALERKNL
ncbi:D-alanine--D-alanine ligase [[Leptolyngbya] sp. PCC 7376]|uniref:D-alanine--D-alanine ligase n=1 Tax=[Leptolyngbya] sp. PCC 7376 TaxID=111781 RepID=UPI00029F4224|nr:D-alanine--D-alanine ligase [[Leptolyngbya] sp. PCC 7376]AFY38650.1 D-alanine--D-alanine ligase [[Leptolyngbya] sp. PCC 7376]